MTCEIAELKKKLLETDLTENNLKDNDEKTAFYTGLPNFLVYTSSETLMHMCCQLQLIL